jgi:hypothetical protein
MSTFKTSEIPRNKDHVMRLNARILPFELSPFHRMFRVPGLRDGEALYVLIGIC